MTPETGAGAGMKRDLVYSLLLHAVFFLVLPYLAIKAPMHFMEVSLSAEMSTVPQDLKRQRRRAQKTENSPRTWTPGEGEPVPASNIAPEQDLSMPAPDIRDESMPDISAFEEEPDIETPLPDKMLPFFEGKEGQSFQISGPISKRTILRRIYPEYPRAAQMAGISGETTVKFWVSADGIIERVIIEKTSGSEELDRSAVDTVKKWLFAPLGTDEAQIDQWGILTVRFELK